jgi:hypothetical protein
MSILGIPGEVSGHQMASHFPSLPMALPLWVKLSEQSGGFLAEAEKDRNVR